MHTRLQVVILNLTICLILGTGQVFAQALGFTAVRGNVDFSDKLRDWDGFGFNYVELAHTYDYTKFKQEYESNRS